jgi:Na+(H+)/acetate symporter ActP
VAYTIYAASSIKACGTLFNTVLGIDATVAMYIAAVIIICYTFLGGFSAVCWTDFFQGLLMLVALLAVPILILAVENLDTAALAQVYVNAADGTEYVQNAIPHNFVLDGKYCEQKYSRILPLLMPDEVRYGKVLDADCVLMNAAAVWNRGREKLLEDPFYFVDR